MKGAEHDWQALQRTLLLLLFFSFCLYLPTLLHGAFADDDVYLAYNNRFLRESNWTELSLLFLKPANPWEFLPLRDLTYWLDFRLYGDEPNGFHATNLVWYGASSLASFWLFRELILLCRPAWAARATVLSLFGALVFVIHPAHVEAAAWIASRKDLMAGTLSLLSVAMLARAMRRQWPCHELALAALFLAAACFSKASAMTTVLFATVLIGFGGGQPPGVFRARRVGSMLLFWLVVAVAFVIHLKVGETSGIRIENHPGLMVMVERASRILSSLAGILVFPYPLRFYHDVYPFGNWHWLVATCVLLLLFVSLWSIVQRRSLWGFGVVLTLVPLIIYLQFVPFTTWSLASERFVFVSVAGLALVMIDLFGQIGRPRMVGAVVAFVALPSAVVVWDRIADWGEPREVLMSREYKLQPDFHNAIRDRIYFTLLPEKRFEEAAELARKLPRLYARDALLSLVDADQAYSELAVAKSVTSVTEFGTSQQKFCRAVASLRSAVRNGYAHMPDEPDVSYNNIFRMLEKELKNRYGDERNCLPVPTS